MASRFEYDLGSAAFKELSLKVSSRGFRDSRSIRRLDRVAISRGRCGIARLESEAGNLSKLCQKVIRVLVVASCKGAKAQRKSFNAAALCLAPLRELSFRLSALFVQGHLSIQGFVQMKLLLILLPRNSACFVCWPVKRTLSWYWSKLQGPGWSSAL